MTFRLSDALERDLPVVQVVDIGASMVDGADHYAPLVDAGLANVVGFEPDKAQFAALQASGRPHYDYLPYALGTGGPATFHVARYPGCSSIFPPNPEFVDRFSAIGATSPNGNFTVVQELQIETHRLDDVTECPAPDYLKLDIQGAERDVLTHATRTLSSALVIESEVLFGPLYKGQGDFADLTILLREQGFQLLECRSIHRASIAPFFAERVPFPTRGQWLWADAIYVRRWENLDGWTDEQLLKAAAVMHEVYQTYDLVHHLLLEIEFRTGEPLAERFRAAMGRDPELAEIWPVLREAWAKAATRERVERAVAHPPAKQAS
ncbi:MAG: FkbM family methyltransferase [Myxococcota bacterium]